MIPQLHLSKTTYNWHLVHEAFNFVTKNDMNKLYPDLSIKKYQDTRRVSVAKKDVRHTSVLFTGTAKSLFITPHISITMYWTNFYQIYIFYTLHIHDFTYQI